MTTYFSTKPGIDQGLVSNLSQILVGIAQRIQSNDPKVVDEDLTADNGTSKLTVYRLKEGIERFFITDINNAGSGSAAASQLSATSDNINSSTSNNKSFNHVPGGCNVLYMDGHVDFVKYPGPWPGSPLFAAIMSAF